EEDSIHYHVSSRHLMLASSWFKRALTKGGSAESNRNEMDGLFYIDASDWDAEAFLILLRILHLRNKDVPRTVNLEMLAKIAVLVDYYSCKEAIEVFTEIWMTKFKRTTKRKSQPVPTTYCRDLVLWIAIAWTFDLKEEFEQATAVAIRESPETMRTLELPIPARVDTKRHLAIEGIVQSLHGLLEKYRSATYECPWNSGLSFECGYFFLGALTKEMHAMALFDPRPEIPFPGLSFNQICTRFQKIKTLRWIPEGGSYYHECTLDAVMASMVAEGSTATAGLDWDRLKYGKET
ncbi:hypothetical protein BDW02DRAFT_500813, partial [Decorospora gaudefroyi]